VITRLAVPDDAATIAAIHVRSWQQAYRGLLPQNFLDSLDPASRATGWQEAITTQSPPATAIVVITNDEAALGFAHVCPSRDDDERDNPIGELTSIYLHPDVWGQRLGRQLIAHAVDLLRRAGNTAATLWVLNGNTRAIRFYEANGWSADGTTKHDTIADVAVTETRYRIDL
jgi:GNAT superfamily N-acetyltransferase